MILKILNFQQIFYFCFRSGPKPRGGAENPGLRKPGPGAFWRENKAVLTPIQPLKLTPIQPLKLTPMYARVILIGQCAPMRHQKWCLAPDISRKTYIDSSLAGNFGYIRFFKFINIHLFVNFEFSLFFGFFLLLRPGTGGSGNQVLAQFGAKIRHFLRQYSLWDSGQCTPGSF